MVTISNGRIEAVGEDRGPVSALDELDCEGCVVIPGMYDCHTHLFQILGRGLGDGDELMTWLRRYMLPLALEVTTSEAVAAARLAALQAAKCGTVSVLDNHYAPTSVEGTLGVVGAIGEVGLRGAVARGIFGPPTPGGQRMGVPPGFARSIEEELDVMGVCMAETGSGSLVTVWPAPENLVYTHPDLVIAAAELATAAGVRWHTHCSESRFEVEIFTEIQGVRPVRWLSNHGLLSQETTLAHGIWLDDDEVALIGEAGAAISYNPVSNGYLASGVFRLTDVIQAGGVVGLGTDGVAVAGQDIVDVMKAGVLMQRLSHLDPTAATAHSFLKLGTAAGAKFMGGAGGTMSVGEIADMAVLEAPPIENTPNHDPVANLIYSGRARARHTVVGGKVIVRDGRSTTVDEDEVVALAAEAARSLASRLPGQPR